MQSRLGDKVKVDVRVTRGGRWRCSGCGSIVLALCVLSDAAVTQVATLRKATI